MYRPKLFAGIELDSRTRHECAAVAARLEVQGVRAVFEAAEKLHVTIAFLGWVDATRVEEVFAVLQTVAADFKPFELSLDKVGAFPHERNPRIVWIGAREASVAFRVLARAVRERYAGMGFPFEKDAVAHVTIARFKGGRQHLPGLDFAPIPLLVRELALFESVPAGRTTRYEVRGRAPLQGRTLRPLE